jgi:membrane-associated phospholipid phosphatase
VNAPSAAKAIALNNIFRWCGVLLRPPRTRVPRPAVSTLVVIGLMLILTVGSMFFIDVAASDWARALPMWFTDIFEQITDFGLSGWFLFPLGLVLLCLAVVASRPLSLRTQNLLAVLGVRFGFLFLAIGLPGLFVAIVKRLIGRARPYVGIHDDPFAYMPFIWRPEYASMPSGHATTAASAAIAIGALWPRARGVMWVYAFIIMFSRVVVLAHHPSDVIAGGLVGVVGVGLLRRWFAARRLLFSAADLRAFPWPPFKRVGEAARELCAGTGGRQKA